MNIVELKQVLASSTASQIPNESLNKLAAVMIIIYGTEPEIIMTERPKTMNHHGGEISFPGGTWKKDDEGLVDTAIRETKEELGLEISRSKIIGQLKPVTTLNSGFKITPFITIINEIPRITPNSEIASVLKIPLFSLLRTIEDDKEPSHRSIQEMYTFKFQDHVIWGASARMLKQIVTKTSKSL